MYDESVTCSGAHLHVWEGGITSDSTHQHPLSAWPPQVSDDWCARQSLQVRLDCAYRLVPSLNVLRLSITDWHTQCNLLEVHSARWFFVVCSMLSIHAKATDTAFSFVTIRIPL